MSNGLIIGMLTTCRFLFISFTCNKRHGVSKGRQNDIKNVFKKDFDGVEENAQAFIAK